MTNQALLTTEFGRLIISEHLEHCRVDWHLTELFKEVILPLVSPAINIVRLNFDLEGPVVVLNPVTVLIVLGQLHDRHGASVIGHLVQMFANRITGALILHLTQDVGPTILEKIMRGLAIEGKHSEPVS